MAFNPYYGYTPQYGKTPYYMQQPMTKYHIIQNMCGNLLKNIQNGTYLVTMPRTYNRDKKWYFI